MVPKEEALYPGIVKLLQHFRWTLIGLLAPDTDNGERFLKSLTPVLIKSGVCVVISLSIQGLNTNAVYIPHLPFLKWRQVHVFVYYGEMTFFLDGLLIVQCIFDKVMKFIFGKIFITTVLWDVALELMYNDISFQYIHGIFSFFTETSKGAKYGDFLPFFFGIKKFWEDAFNCFYLKHAFSVKGRTRCRERGKLERLPQDDLERILSLDSYRIYNTLQAVARALNAAYSSRSKQRGTERMGLQRLQPWQVFSFPS